MQRLLLAAILVGSVMHSPALQAHHCAGGGNHCHVVGDCYSGPAEPGEPVREHEHTGGDTSLEGCSAQRGNTDICHGSDDWVIICGFGPNPGNCNGMLACDRPEGGSTIYEFNDHDVFRGDGDTLFSRLGATCYRHTCSEQYVPVSCSGSGLVPGQET